MNLFWKVVLAVVLTVAALGVIAPKLISSHDDLSVLAGFGVIVAWAFIMLFPMGTVKWMKKNLGGAGKGAAMLIVGMMALSSIGCSRVPPGNVGIKVNLLGGEKGVDTQELGVGRYYIGINEQLFVFPTFAQNYVWTKDSREGSEDDESISFQTIEGMEVNGDFGIQYQIDPTKVSVLFQKYRRGVTEITDVFLRNLVRDEINKLASKLKVEDIYGLGKEALMNDLNTRCANAVVEQGIIIDKIYVIGTLRLPQAVVDSLNNKIAATQKAQMRENEIREAEAAAQKKIADANGDAQSILMVAKAQAEANTILGKSLTPEFVQYQMVIKWDGALSQYSGVMTPLIQLPGPTK
jgi:regulator of protease activity HflC (stomatin/prohibitin superfamily)